MLFIVQFEDIYAHHPERLPERAQHMPAHLAFLARHEKQVIAAGALRPAPDAAPIGGIWIINAPSKEAAEALLRQDPFWIAGLRRSVRVSYWARAFWSTPFAACMEAADAV